MKNEKLRLILDWIELGRIIFNGIGLDWKKLNMVG